MQSVLRDMIRDLIVEAREIENDDDWEFVRLKKKRQALHQQRVHGSRKTTAQTVVSVL
jgi:hypothetical protein